LPSLDASTPLPNELSYDSTEEIEGKWLAIIYLKKNWMKLEKKIQKKNSKKSLKILKYCFIL
jgi:hypothetical protein